MKLKIKVKAIAEEYIPVIKDKGDWIDLKAAQDTWFSKPHISSHDSVTFNYQYIPLGVAMCLPPEYEALLAPRSSLFAKKNLILANSIGVIDNSYNGNEDYWKMLVIALGDTHIHKGEAICQFRIQLSQMASAKTKQEWLTYDGIEFEAVESLEEKNRGGFGSTGGYHE